MTHDLIIERGAFGGQEGLVRSVCTCGRYQSAWTTEARAKSAWHDHWIGVEVA